LPQQRRRLSQVPEKAVFASSIPQRSKNTTLRKESTAMSEQSSPKRPVLVWIICIFYLIATFFTALSLFLVISGRVPASPEQASFFSNLKPIDYLLSVTIMFLNICGVIALFGLRKEALYLFLASLGVNIASYASLFTTTNAETLSANIGSILFGWLLAGAVCFYTWRLKTSGVLR
jgi:hypothetical protein